MMINKIIDYLDYLYPNPKCELEYSKDYELLLAIVMSAQTTDKRVNMVNKELFKKYDTLSKINNAPTEEIEKIIKPIGTYKKKAIYIKEIARILVKDNIKTIISCYKKIGYDVFTNEEISKIKKIFKMQNTWLTIVGLIIGLPLGFYMTDAIFKLALSDGFDFSADIKLISYAYAIVGTLVVAFIVNRVLAKKINTIDMVSSLKGNE